MIAKGCDVRIETLLNEMIVAGVDTADGAEFARRAASDITLEGNLRHLVAENVLYQYGDKFQADKIRLTNPDQSIPAPSWLLDGARQYSSNILRHNYQLGSASGNQRQQPHTQPPDHTDGKGKGRGKGKGKQGKKGS